MNRFVVVFVVAVLAVLSGVSAVLLSGRGPAVPPPRSNDTTERSYLTLTDEEAMVEASRKLSLIASAQADQLANVKDDVALLMRRQVILDWVREQFDSRAASSPYQAGAFADLFARVSDPAFVEPTKSLFTHEKPWVRVKGPPAALTQADPSLTESLFTYYQRFSIENPGTGANTKQRILQAAQRCGGPSLWLLLKDALTDSDGGVRSYAAQIVGEEAVEPLRQDVRKLLRDESVEVRFHASAALARMNDSVGIEELLSFLTPEGQGWSIQASRMVRELRLGLAERALLAGLSATDDATWSSFVETLAVLGSKDVQPHLEAALKAGHRPRELGAMTALAAMSTEADLERLLALLALGGEDRIEALATGFAEGSMDPPLRVAEVLFAAKPSHPRLLTLLVKRMGDRVVPFLVSDLLRSEPDSTDAVVRIAALGEVGTLRAREGLASVLERHGRLARERLRLLDLYLLKRERSA